MTRYKGWLAVVLMMACTAAQVSELEQLAELGASVAAEIAPLVAPADAAKVKALDADFANLVGVYNDVKGSLGTGDNLTKLVNAFNAVTADKSIVERSVNITDPKSLATFTQGLTTIDQTLANISALIPEKVVAGLGDAQVEAVRTAKRTVHAKPNGKSAAQLKKEWKAYKKAHPLKATK